jgi:WD40 repeat protein
MGPSMRITRFLLLVLLGLAGAIAFYSRVSALSDTCSRNDFVTAVSWSPSGKHFAVGKGCVVFIFDDKFKLFRAFRSHTYLVTSVFWHPVDDLLASGSADNTIYIWNVNTGAIVNTWKALHKSIMYVAAWNPKGDQIATGSLDGDIHIWNAKSGTLIKTLRVIPPDLGYVYTLDWHPNGKEIAAAQGDRGMRIWDIASSKVQHHLDIEGEIYTVAWSPDGEHIASGQSPPYWAQSFSLWDKNGKAVTQDKFSVDNAIATVLWLKDNRRIAINSLDGKTYIWDTTAQKMVAEFTGGLTVSESIFANTMSVSPDDSKVANFNEDGLINIWDINSRKLITSFEIPTIH